MKNNIISLKEYNLHPVREGLLCVYKEIARICEKFSLRYWAAYGTALGAVRHKGFIPWDDDLDLMMPREDYDKFMVLADRELPDYMKTVSIFNTKEFHWGFGKVQDCRVDELERIQRLSRCSLPDGIYVDIFPIDGCLRAFLPRMGRMIVSCCLHLKQHIIFGRRKFFVLGLIDRLISMFLPPLSDDRDFMLYDIERLKCSMLGGAVRCGYLSDEVSRAFIRRPLCVAWFSDTKIVPFEDTVIPIPSGIDGILRTWYGDYMELPPLSKRQVPSHANDPIVAWRLGPTGIA